MDAVKRAACLAFLLAPLVASATPQPMTRQEVLDLARSGVGYSYWWGNGCWRTDGAQHGSCSGSCPSCTHSGGYGADCSGFAAKVWQVPSASAVSSCSHPYSTYNFVNQSTWWTHISRGSVLPGDALTYNTNGKGHIAVYERGDPWGSMWLFEARGCSYGIVHNLRALSSSYGAIRRVSLVAACTPTTEVCNGQDDDCDNQVDEGDVCLEQEEALFQAGVVDGRGTSDINGDGKADVCGRAAAGVRCHLSTGTGFGGAINGPELSNAAGWNDPSHGTTLRMGDVNGDGRADLCARAASGFKCWLSTGSAFGTVLSTTEMSDSAGWDDVKYFGTIRLADINGDGKDDVCARSASGFKCWPSTGTGFGAVVDGPGMTDANGWGAAHYAGTIRMGDVNGDGKADVCARAAAGMFCWISDGTGFPTRITGPAWSNDNGWDDLKYWSTIRLADINGDGKDDLCGRSSTDFRCHLSTGTGFGAAIVGPALSDATGWGDHANYSTLRMADVNGDGRADVCARANAGVRCWLSHGNGFDSAATGPELSDASGWSGLDHLRPLRMADVNGDGKVDLCARAAAGVKCWLSNGSAPSTEITGPAWSDSSGWSSELYYPTIRMAGPATLCTPTTEVCDGRDNNCNSQVDEGAVCHDGGTPDASRPDASRPDATVEDAAFADAARADAAVADAAVADAAVPDASRPDAALPDAALPDATVPDAAWKDAGEDAVDAAVAAADAAGHEHAPDASALVADAGGGIPEGDGAVEDSASGNCACGMTGSALDAGVLVLGAWLLRARRRR